jgi:transposase
LEDLIFIDETGMNLAMTRRYARALKGERARGKQPKQRGKNITMIGGLSLKKFLAPVTFPGGTDGAAFKAYVKQILVPELWPGACVVMDNFNSHKVDGIEEMIIAAGAKVIFLSPYSPEFNPIENCWSKFKEYLRSKASRTYEDLIQSVSEAIDTITPQDIIGWFTHCCYYVEPI